MESTVERPSRRLSDPLEKVMCPMDHVSPTSASPRRIPTWLKVAGGVVWVLLLLYVGAAVLLRAVLDPRALAEWAEPRIEAALNRDVSLDGVRLTFFPGLGADIRGVTVENLPEFGGPPLLEVERVRLRVALRPLLRRRVEVANVRVDSPVLRLLVDAEGRNNFGEFAPAADEPPDAAPGPVDLALRSIRLEDGRVEYESVPDSMALVLTDVQTRAALELLRDGTWSVASRSRSAEILMLHPMLGEIPRTFRSVGLEADARAGPEGSWVEIERGTLHLEDAAFSLTGRAENLMEAVRRIDLALAADGLDVARFMTFLPDEATASLPGHPAGVLDVSATLRGDVGVGVRPDLRGTVSLRDGGIRTPEGEVVAEGVAGQVLLHNDSLSIQELAGRALGGPFSVSASVSPDSLLPFRADLRANPQLDRIRFLIDLPEGTTLAGRAEAGLSIVGRALDPVSVAVDGSVELRDFQGELPDLAVPVRVASASFRLAGQTVTWQGVEVGLGADRVTTWGTVREYLAGFTGPEGAVPHLELTATTARLDMDRLFPPRADTAVTYGQIAFAHLGGREIEGRSARDWAREKGFARPDDLPLSGEARLRADTLISAPFRLTGVDATVHFTPRLIQVAEARAGLFGGRVRTEGTVTLGPEEEQPFTFALEVEDIQASDFLQATSPAGRFVRGVLGMQMEAAGTLDRQLLPEATALAGDGALQVADGQLLEMPLTRLLSRSLSRPELSSPRFQDWAGRFRIEGSRLILDETLLALGLAEGEMRFGGVVGLDGGLDVALRVAAPAARLDSLALARTGLVGAAVGSLTSRDGPVRLGLRLGGTFDSPRITPEASLALGDLGQTLDAEARDRARVLQAEGEQRAEEARDTIQARAEAAADTVQARLEAERRRAEERAEEELRRELERRRGGLLDRLRPGAPPPADTVRSDTTRADTLPRDTVPPDTLRNDTITRDTIPRDTLTRGSGPG